MQVNAKTKEVDLASLQGRLQANRWKTAEGGCKDRSLFHRATSILAPFHEDVLVIMRDMGASSLQQVIDSAVAEAEQVAPRYAYINLFLLCPWTGDLPQQPLLKRGRIQVTIGFLQDGVVEVLSRSDWWGKGLSDKLFLEAVLKDPGTCSRFARLLLVKFALILGFTVALMIFMVCLSLLTKQP